MKKLILIASLAVVATCSMASATTTNIYNEWGGKTGSVEESTYGGEVTYRNSWGGKTGSARPNSLGGYDYYNEWGGKTGSSR